MALTQSRTIGQSQRVEVELAPGAHEMQVKIRVENYDEKLGWYSAGALTLPLHQLPLLEQAIADMRSIPDEDEEKIIPFPSPCDAG